MTEKKDVGFIGALCKSKERLLIGEEKFARMIDTDTAEDAFRMLRESGFGGDAEASGARDFEKLIAAETESLIGFSANTHRAKTMPRHCSSRTIFIMPTVS